MVIARPTVDPDRPAAGASVDAAIDWRETLDAPVPYPEAVVWMERRVAAIRERMEPEAVWLLEHPPLYTAGTSAREADLLDTNRFPVYRTGRGGQYTYHGPGQIVGYTMLDLTMRGSDLRRFVRDLEEWLIVALAAFGVRGERREGRVGIWVDRGDGHENKIAAIGVRVRKWVSYHGISFNVEPRLEHYDGIVPCGIGEHGVTSLVDLGLPASLDDAAGALRHAFEEVFGRRTVSR